MRATTGGGPSDDGGGAGARATSVLSRVAGEELELFFDMCPDILGVASYDGVVRHVNSAVNHLLGHSPDDVVGIDLTDAAHPDDQRSLLAAFFGAKEHGESAVEVRIVHAAGGYRWIRWSLKAIPLLQDVYLTGQDVTELHELQTELEHRLEDLHRSNRDLEQFAYLASHDLQAPLRTVRGFNDLLLEQVRVTGGVLDEKGAHYKQLVDAAVNRMEGLIRGLLDFSRVESRGGDLAAQVDLNGVVDSLQEALGHLIVTNDATVTREDLPPVPGDREQLACVLQNLIQNAIKYRSADRAPVVTVTVLQEATSDASSVVVVVADNGLGIDPRFSERVFQMFKQLHPPGAYDGIGLGLPLARRIVERHGGSMWLESDGSSGTSFFVRLPLVREEEE